MHSVTENKTVSLAPAEPLRRAVTLLDDAGMGGKYQAMCWGDKGDVRVQEDDLGRGVWRTLDRLYATLMTGGMIVRLVKPAPRSSGSAWLLCRLPDVGGERGETGEREEKASLGEPGRRAGQGIDKGVGGLGFMVADHWQTRKLPGF